MRPVTKITLFSITALAIFEPQLSFGSQDSIGPNGIHSSVLSLSGNGVDIGQVETGRPGDPSFDTNGALFNTTVDPDMVFNRFFAGFQSVADNNGEITAHATDVAGIMISDDATATGVSPNANLLSVAISPDGIGGVEGVYTQTALSAQHLATLPGRDVRAINMSIAVAGGVQGVDGADERKKGDILL